MTKELHSADPAKAVRDPKALRNAATVMILRDASAGMEVLMLQRPERDGDRFGGSYVFPGGVIESNDRRLHSLCEGLDDRAASAKLRVSEHGLDYFVAAIRECFEEAGLLLACGPDGDLIDLDNLGGEPLAALRNALQAGTTSLEETCEKLDLRLAVDRLAYHSRWITPPGVPKRFDTHFFVTIAPASQTALHDGYETVHHYWLRPADALARADELKLRTATLSSIESLLPFASAQACFEHALAQRDIEVYMSRLATDASGIHSVMPNHPAYAEIARIDPEGSGHASCEIEAGRAVRLSERVIRVTAPNGHFMTGPGTNAYLVGGGERNEWAVIDPGPDMAGHVPRIVAAAPGPIRWIFVTHTHEDHSPAAAELKALTGAPLHGLPAPDQDWQDRAFRPDRVLAHGERICLTESTTLRVVHTPGHASNHLCYLLEEEKTLFTGDHLMQGSSVVIAPPDGDMADYLASLRALLEEDLDWLAPGHGHLMNRVPQAIGYFIEHRLKREAKVIDALRELAPATADTLLRRVYDDVPEERHGMAMHSLLAHLIKLSRDGLTLERNGLWQFR